MIDVGNAPKTPGQHLILVKKLRTLRDFPAAAADGDMLYYVMAIQVNGSLCDT